MKVFPAELVNQGSPEWHELRRGIPTSSSFDRIITAVGKQCVLPVGHDGEHVIETEQKPVPKKPPGKKRCQVKVPQMSSQAEDYAADLAADVADMSPTWYTERANKPPNKAIEDGIAREKESRDWLAYTQDIHVQQVGFCLHHSGLFGCSPDGLLVADSGEMDGSLELKNPQLHTQAKYLLSGDLPAEYRAQCHGHLVVTGLQRCQFLSYCPPLDPLLIDVRRDAFTDALEAALTLFGARYLEVLKKLKLLNRFGELRASILSHYPNV